MKLFKIRREVMQALDLYSREAFEERMFVTMNERHREECAALGDEAVRHVILQGIARALRYAIFKEGDIEIFLDLLFKRGLDFDVQTPWAKKIFINPELAGRVKVRLIAELAD